MTSQKQAALGAFWGTVERAATQGISFIVVLILARILGPANFGLVTLAATIALFGQMLLGETFSQALIQQRHLEPAHSSSLFWVLLGAGTAATAVVFAAAGWLAAIFSQPDIEPILRALSPLLLFSAIQAIPNALFRRELDFRALAAASTSGTFLGGVIGVALAFLGFGPWSLVANLLVQNAVITAAIWRQSPFRPQWLYSHRHLRELWSYGQYTFLLRIAAFTANQGPRIIVGYIFGAAALGAFSLGLRIVEITCQLLSLPAANVVIPVVAKIRHDTARLERAILGATQLAAMVAVPAFVGLALIAPFAVPFIFGAQWMASIPIVQILAFYGIVFTCGLIWTSIIGGLGRPDISLVITSVAAVVSVTVLVLMSRWGVTAASAAFVVRGYVSLPFLPLLIARLTGISAWKQYRVFGPIALAAIILALAVKGLIVTFGDVLTPIEMTAAAILVGAAAYTLALYLFARPALQLGASLLAHLHPRQKAV